MPSQEEYLDNLLKGIENAETTESVEERNKPESEEQDVPQIDMSDMDDLLQSALNAQKEDAVKDAVQDTVQDTVSENMVIHPEETASMSEDEIDRLLQQNREQAEEAPKQENTDSNDDLIRMLESAPEILQTKWQRKSRKRANEVEERKLRDFLTDLRKKRRKSRQKLLKQQNR